MNWYKFFALRFVDKAPFWLKLFVLLFEKPFEKVLIDILSTNQAVQNITEEQARSLIRYWATISVECKRWISQ